MKTLFYNNIKFKHLVLILSIILFSCNNIEYSVHDIKAENTKVLDFSAKNDEINSIISPYRNQIKKLEKEIGYSKKSLSVRDGDLESTLGNFIADVLMKESDSLFNSITSQRIDFCLLNKGGVRGTLNKGRITHHNLINILPFENTSTVVKLTGKKILELLEYLNSENKAHPSSGIKIEFINNKINSVLIGGKKFDVKKKYYVLTSNYLQAGGDKMNFFTNPLELYSLNTNIREVLIDHISKIKIVEGKLDKRIVRLNE